MLIKREPLVDGIADPTGSNSDHSNSNPDGSDSVTYNFARLHLPPEDVDTILSNELLQLSSKDRNAIDEEIHGVRQMARKENPEFLKAALLRLSEEIDRIPDTNPIKSAYNKSQKIGETYVNKEDFRLRFLRCDLFDAKKAAMRLVKFLDLAFSLFGHEVLERPMKISDLSIEEMKLMRMGPFQVLPYRDRSGRPVVTWVDDFATKHGDKRFRAKMTMYMMYALSDDIESQRRGFVHITWPGSKPIAAVPDLDELDLKLMQVLPIRLCAGHFCVPDKPFFHIIRSMFAITMGSTMRSRLKFHIGEPVELEYALRSFGIPFELIPVTGTGNVKTAYHRQWIRLRKAIDNERTKGIGDGCSMIEIPRSADVIFRTGNSLTCHPGNSIFQDVIQSKIQQHSTATQVEKMTITKEIIEQIQRNNGRFLQWDKNGWWIEIEGRSHIHAKVAVAVRDFKSKVVAKANRQNCQSGTSVFQNQDGKRRKVTHNFDSDDDVNEMRCSLLSLDTSVMF